MLIADRFEIEKEIGRGGIGVVYKAIDKKANNNPVVVKVLIEQKDNATRDWVERHFLKEAKALKLINHPSVVQLIDSGTTSDGNAFFAMEYVKGYDLRSQIDPKRGLIGDYERVAKIIYQLGDAISAAHEKGIYHRDLKPENIMLQKPQDLDDEEQVKVIDFGIATVKDSYDEKTKTTQLLAGSLHYMAPEQLENRPSSSSDIYSLGAIAYEMVTGRPPFMPEAPNYAIAIFQLLQMQKQGVKIKPKDLRPSLPEVAQIIILKALAFEPEERYKVARNFGSDLAKALKSNWIDSQDADTFIKQSEENRRQINIRSKKIDAPETWLADDITKASENPNSNVNLNNTNTFVSQPAKSLAANYITEIQFLGEPTKSNTLAKDNFSDSEHKETLLAETIKNVSNIEKNLPKNKTNSIGSYKINILEKIAIGIIIVLGLATLWIYKVKFLSKPQTTESIVNLPKVPNTTEIALNYSIRWYSKDKPPVTLTDEINEDILFDNGDEVEFIINSLTDGYLYIIHEPEKMDSKDKYTIIFPSPKNPKSKTIEKEQVSVRTVLYDTGDKIEKIWIIFSNKQILGLEQAFVRSRGKEGLSEVKDLQQEKALKDLLGENALLEGITIKKDKINQQMKVISSKEPLIYSFILKRK